MSQPQTPEQAAALQAVADEYGQYVATGPIYHEGALAYTQGQPVPASNVDKYGYLKDGLVESTSKKPAAKSAAN